MEKQPNTNGTICRARLLTCFIAVFCLISLPNYAQGNESSLTVKPVAPQFYVNRPIQYILTIPNARPTAVEYALQTLPREITLASARKESASGTGEPVTRIVFDFMSQTPGPIELPELIVSINGEWIIWVPFEKAMLVPDPMKSRPFLILRPESNAPAVVGKPYALTLYARNVAAITGFDVDLGEDALFSVAARLNALETGEGLELSLSHEVPLARLEWLPLKAGSFRLPSVNVSVRSFAGDLTNIRPDAITVSVGNAGFQGETLQAETANPFAAAFDDSSLSDALTASPAAAAATDTDAAIQEAFQQMSKNAKKSLRVFTVFLAAFVLLIGMVLFTVASRRYKTLIPAAALLAVVAFGTLRAGLPVFRTGGIFTGGEIKAVPEKASSPVGNFPPGTALTILKRSKTWYYVSHDEASGWVPAESVLVVQGH